MDDNYKILILGPRGSGKTVMLSSMYYHLSLIGPTNFFLQTTDYNVGLRLKNAYRDLIQNKKWMQATAFGDFNTFEFQCMVKTSLENFEAFKITYYDYSGGRITDGHEDYNQFKNAVDKSSVLLGLIDGESLANALKEKNYYSKFFLTDLEEIITQLATHHDKGKIIQIVISKWDILHGKYSLKEIIDHLLEFPRFKQFVDSILKNDGKVRLIPVSSVGFDFAELTREGEMKIKDNGSLQAYNIHLPISLALLDPMKAAIEAIEKNAKEIEERNAGEVSVHLSWWQRLARWTGDQLDNLCTKYNIDNGRLTKMAAHWKSVGQDRIESAKREKQENMDKLKEQLGNIRNRKDAAEYVMTCFFDNELDLDEEHPFSLIEPI